MTSMLYGTCFVYLGVKNYQEKFDTAITEHTVYKQRKVSEFQDSGSQVLRKQGCSMTGFLEKSVISNKTWPVLYVRVVQTCQEEYATFTNTFFTDNN